MSEVRAGLAAAPRSLVEAQRDAARERILRAARRALAERGLDTRVEDVAIAAGTSRRTVFRYFPSRDELLAAAVLDGIRSYRAHIPRARPGVPVEEWLSEALVVLHRMNAHNGRGYWELALRPDLAGPLAEAASLRRQGRRELVEAFTKAAWEAAGGKGGPPRWLEDAFAIHLSAFATEALAGDFGRTPEEVGRVSARVLAAALAAALHERGGGDQGPTPSATAPRRPGRLRQKPSPPAPKDAAAGPAKRYDEDGKRSAQA